MGTPYVISRNVLPHIKTDNFHWQKLEREKKNAKPFIKNRRAELRRDRLWNMIIEWASDEEAITSIAERQYSALWPDISPSFPFPHQLTYVTQRGNVKMSRVGEMDGVRLHPTL